MSKFQVLAVDAEAGGSIKVLGQFLVPHRNSPALPTRVIVLKVGKHKAVLIQSNVDPDGSYGECPRSASPCLGTFLLCGGKVSSFEVLDLALSYFVQLKAHCQSQFRSVPASVLFKQAVREAEAQYAPKP